MSDLLKKSIAVAIPFITNIPGSIVTRNEVKTWYKTIKKPSFVPPNYVFGPVWSVLFASMGYSSYIIWKEVGFTPGNRLPLILYSSQLLLNSSWSVIFFGMHKIGLSVVNMSMLYANVLACIVVFRPISKTASNLMIPYLMWLTLAGAVNLSTWRLNKDNPSASS